MRRTDKAIDFQAVREIVDSVGPGGAAVQVVDKLISAGLILSPVVFGPAVTIPLLALFDMKSDLVRHVTDVAQRLAGTKGSFLERGQALAAAHWLITYAAFFEAVNDLAGDDFNGPALAAKAQFFTVTRDMSDLRLAGGEVADTVEIDGLEYAGMEPVSLPHPAATFATEAEERLRLYQAMTGLLRDVMRHVRNPGRKARSVSKLWETLPAAAVQRYHAQYLELMLEYRDFFGYAMLYEHQKTQDISIALAETAAAELRRFQQALHGIDQGLTRLSAAVAGLPARDRTGSEAQRTAVELHKYYRARAAEPVIEDDPPGSGPQLVFPSRAKTFIPQACKIVVYDSEDQRLEDEATWRGAPERADLGGFLVHYLTSDYSTETPLVVLGHPGSGKSLLTRMLAARLAPPAFTTVRIELRDIDPDTELQDQIEAQIRQDTGRRVNWAAFAEQLHDEPPLIILDGYDELLQSTGQVHATYLKKVQRFQERERIQNRPVRVIITSRITLIDKAAVPLGATILRLLEFDGSRRHRWAKIWNRANQAYFAETGVRPFVVPESPELLELARQPLLLLMLALYDSNANELAGEQIDQTQLYHSLLARFVRRELEKGTDEVPADPAAVEADMRRLAVVAIGMFNRNAVHARRQEIDKDLAYFKAERPADPERTGTRLSQADLLLGSFFFVHESRGRTGDRDDSFRGVAAAFEFLHNTFGEFLAADFIVDGLLESAIFISRLGGDERMRGFVEEHCAKQSDQWYATFAFVPLSARPVILQMVREWLPYRARQAGLSDEAVASAVRMVVDRQLLDVASRRPPEWFVSQIDASPYEYQSLLGHLAVYTLNLALIGAVSQPDGYRIPESDYWPVRQWPWLSLTHLWRGWFTSEQLLGVAALVTGEHDESGTLLRARARILTPDTRSPVDVLTVVSALLGDHLTAAVAAQASADLRGAGPGQLQGVGHLFALAGFPIWPAIEAASRKTGEVVDDSAWKALSATLPAVGRAALRTPLPRQHVDLLDAIDAADLSEAAVEAVGRIGGDTLEDLLRLSPYQLTRLISVKARMNPVWLFDAVSQLLPALASGTPDVAPILSRLLRTVRRVGSYHRFLRLATALVEPGRPGLPVEAAAELLLLGARSPWRADADAMLARALTSYEQLRDLPEESMLELLLTMAEPGGAPLSAAAMPELVAQHIDHRDSEVLPFTLMLAVVIFLGHPVTQYLVTSKFRSPTADSTQQFLAFVRVARLIGALDLLTDRYFDAEDREAFGAGTELRRLVGADSISDLEDRLTFRQLDDLWWLLAEAPFADEEWRSFRNPVD